MLDAFEMRGQLYSAENRRLSMTAEDNQIVRFAATRNGAREIWKRW